MGSYTTVHLTVAIEIKPVKASYKYSVRGCADCEKEHSRMVKFCPECGEKITDFSTYKDYMIQSWSCIFERFMDEQKDWGKIVETLGIDYDEDSFYTPPHVADILIWNKDSSHSLTVEENTYTEIPKEYNEFIDDFKIEHEALLFFLDDKGFEPKVTFGCMFDYS